MSLQTARLRQNFMLGKTRPHKSIEKFGWQPGDLRHSKNVSPHIWAQLSEDVKKRFIKDIGYNEDGTLPEWDSLTDEQKKRFAPYKNSYGLPLD